MKNPPEFYEEAYLKHQIGGAGGAERIQDNGAYYQAARFIKDFCDHVGLGFVRSLDVGCGLGYVVRHLRNLGIEGHGCEYGKWTQEHNVVSGVLWADLTEYLPYETAYFDFVSCLGVLSQFPERYAVRAVEELRRVTKKYVWVNIQTEWRELQAHHRNIRPKGDWLYLFEYVGFQVVETDFLRSYYPEIGEQLSVILEKTSLGYKSV